MTSRIALGTVQFGLSYGIANRTGQISSEVVGEILDIARAGAIDTLDTAIGYGASERVLGTAGVSDFKVVTKLPTLPDDVPDVKDWVDTQVRAALERLKLPRLHALLLHRPGDLLRPQGAELRRALLGLKAIGIVRMVGYSIYSPSELDQLVAILQPDLVQSPFSVLDQRLKTSGWMERLAGAGVEIHARSLFLQGLLLMEEEDIPSKFAPWSAHLRHWRNWVMENNFTRLQAALGFGLQHHHISRLVVGIDGGAHLSEILAASAKPHDTILDTFGVEDEDLINPSRW